MKTEVKRNLDKTYLLIEEAGIYEEDYQMHMLRENKIPGLLEVRGRGAGENSQYYYDISCKVSMKTKYEKIPIGYEELKAFLYQLLTVMKEMKKYFLSEIQSLFIMKRECSFSVFCRVMQKRRRTSSGIWQNILSAGQNIKRKNVYFWHMSCIRFPCRKIIQ